MVSGRITQLQRTAWKLVRGDALDRPDVILRVSMVVLVALTLVVAAVPAIHAHVSAPALDLALDTVAATVCGSLTALAWARFGERREAIALYQAGAFLALAVAYTTAVLVTLENDTSRLGDPIAAQAYVFAIARIVAAVLLIVGGTAMQRRAAPRHPGVLLLMPGLVVAITATLAYRLGAMDSLPEIIVVDASGALPTITAFGLMVQVLKTVLFFEAAAVCRTLWRRDHVVMDAWIAVGLVFAAFAEVHWALYPSGHPGQVSSADLLRLASFIAFLLGIEAEARVTLVRLRTANLELAQLREADVERAALEERARLARELHDGLAQDLWLAKLKAGQLAQTPGLAPDAERLVEETTSAIDSGLSEARQAVLALRISSSTKDGFCSLMQRYVEDFEDRFGVRVEYRCEGDGAPVAARTQAEVLRIAQEALTNVRQHAQATVIGVRLAIRGRRISMRVVDNGRGFDPAAHAADTFGLSSMRERAALIGGRLVIRSRPGEGTSVVLSAPVAPAPAPVASRVVR